MKKTKPINEEKILRQAIKTSELDLKEGERIIRNMAKNDFSHQIIKKKLNKIIESPGLPEEKWGWFMEFKNKIDEYNLDEELEQYINKKAALLKQKIIDWKKRHSQGKLQDKQPNDPI